MTLEFNLKEWINNLEKFCHWITRTRVLDSYRSLLPFQKINFLTFFLAWPRPYFDRHVSAVEKLFLFQLFLLWRNDIEWKIYFTHAIQEQSMKHLFLIRHNHKYKLSKGENGLLKFVHAGVNYTFLCGWWDCFNGDIIDQNSILLSFFIFYEK